MMQIKTMPTSTTLFKHKWNLFITKLSPTTTNTKRRSSNSSNTDQKRRKHSSDAVSVGTFESSISMADKFRQVIPFFRRRSTSHIGSNTTFEESTAHMPTTATTITNNTSAESYDLPKELEKLKSLYTLALDEVNIIIYIYTFIYKMTHLFQTSSVMLRTRKDHPITLVISLLHVKLLMIVQMLSCNY
jgi:hypothetical protein